jgi:hypothetical protein
MGNTRLVAQRYRSLGLLLLAVAILASSIIASCGGGGSSNGGLCEQCGGSPDGPCQATGFVVPGATAPVPCPSPGQPNACVEVGLICRRKVDSAQQRCFPLAVGATDVRDPNPNFRCDGSRPGGTVLPEPTKTPTPTNSTNATPTKTVSADQVCGDGIITGSEQCDDSGPNLGTSRCGDFCADDTGQLQCNGCALDTSQCGGGSCRATS